MKPKDLKPPYSFAERKPLLKDSVFFVPDYYSTYQTFSFPDLSAIFRNLNPVNLEYCSGNGDWVIERASKDKEQNWIAVEMRFDRVRKIWAKMKNQGLENLLIVCGEAFTFTHHYLSDASLEGVYINFPDPWPKARHEKHRLIKPSFLEELGRVLHPGKSVCFVTDDQDYLQETLGHFRKVSHRFSAKFPAPFYTQEMLGYGSSWFEELWREKGKTIYYTQFINEQST